MEKTGLLFQFTGEICGVYYECFTDLETGRVHIFANGLTSISGK